MHIYRFESCQGGHPGFIKDQHISRNIKVVSYIKRFQEPVFTFPYGCVVVFSLFLNTFSNFSTLGRITKLQ
jgi:hypothetical protein